MKTNRSNKVGGLFVFSVIVFFVAIAAIIFTCVYLPSADIIRNKIDIIDVEDGWTLINSDGTEEAFTGFNKRYEVEDVKEMTISRKMDFLENKNIDSICIQTFYSAVEIKINGEPAKDFEGNENGKYGIDELESDSLTLLGNYFFLYEFNKEAKSTDTLTITFKTSSKYIYILPIEAGCIDDFMLNICYNYIAIIIMLCIAIYAFLIVVVFALSKRTGKFIRKNYIYFALFFASCTVWEFLDSQYPMIFGLHQGAISFASNEIYMLLPLTLLFYTYTTCKWKKVDKVFDYILIFLTLANFLAQNYAYFEGYHYITDTMFASHAIVFLTILNTIIQLFGNWIRSLLKKNEYLRPERKFLGFNLIAFILFIASCGIQLYAFYLDPSIKSLNYLSLGFILMAAVVTYSIIDRINEQIDIQGQEHIDMMWEEKKKVDKVRGIMNEAFKTIIPEQYIAEVIDAYEKRDALLKESADGTLTTDETIIKIGHSRRVATILVSDVRGFSEISTKYDQRVGDMLNHYLSTMTDIVEKYGGHVLEFMGDGILAGFGTIEQDKYQADNAIKAAIEMQKTMPEINAWNEKNGFPGQLEIGIGINTGNVFSGIIGSLERFKFDVLGQEVNLASRIETYTTGGQILISQKTKEAVISTIGTYKTIKATPKGSDVEQTYYLVNAIGDLSYNIKGEDFKKLNNPIKVEYRVFEDKGNAKNSYSGVVTHLSENGIIMTSTAKTKLAMFDIVTVIHNGGVTCKVTKVMDKGYELRFTSPNKRNDGQPIFEDVEDNPDEYEELERETRKLLRHKEESSEE